MFKPYGFQQNIIKEARTALSNGFTAPLVQSPTGSGKTIMFSWICQAVFQKGKRCLILTHRREILEQTIKKLFAFGLTCGQVASGMHQTRDLIQVTMVGTLINRMQYIEKPDLLIVDECHHSTSPTWSKILNYFYDVPRIGFSATPERLDGQGLGDLFDIMIHGPQVAELVKLGFLSEPHIFSSEKATNKKYHMKRGDFDKEEQTTEMSKRVIVGDVIDHKRKFLRNLPTVTFCPSIKHCQIMNDNFNDSGIKSMVIHGKLKKEPRENMIKSLSDGTIENINSCEVISEGVDIPVIAGAILLRRTMSLALYLQQVGRALRVYPGKKGAIILDHCGNVFIHGHVLDDRAWSLNQEKRKAKKEKAPEITRCPSCLLILPGKPLKCVACGHDFEYEAAQAREDNIEQIEGELSKILPSQMVEGETRNLAEFVSRLQGMDKGKRHKAMWAMAHQLGDKDKIRALSKMVGYHRNWIEHVWPQVSKTVRV